MPAKMDLDLAGAVFTDELHTDVGAAAFEIDHDFFTQEDLVIRTLGGGAGVLLTDGVDYQLSEEDTYLSANTSPAKTVYRNIQVINAAYQTGDLYFSGEYIADANEAADVNLPRLRGHLWGLTLSNNAVDADHDIDIAAGETISDDGERVMVLGAALTKQLDVGWAEGTDAGGLDAGAIAADKTYHMHLIRKDILGTIDALFSRSATAPTMPTGWTARRRIGAVLTDGTANIRAFDQHGDRFILRVLIDDRAMAVIPNTTRNVQALTVPPLSTAIVYVMASTTTAGANMWVRTTTHVDAVASATNHTLRAVNTSTFVSYEAEIPTDASSQIAYRGDHVNGLLEFTTAGWIDTRGRDA